MKNAIITPIFLFVVLCLSLLGFLTCIGKDPAGKKPVTSGKLATYLDSLEKNTRVVHAQKTLELYGNTILGLYKSSDGQQEKENEIFYHLTNLLKSWGYNVKFRDVDLSMPTPDDLKGVRAVISWFRGASLVNPDEYLNFFDATINSGRKFIVIDNFGAYQYRDDPDKYTDIARVNLSLSKLGLQYLGDWTQDPNLLEITYKDAAMVEAGAPQNLADAAFYYNFLQTDLDLKSYLDVRRTDIDAKPSHLIVTNRNGGFALSRYIFRDIDGKPVFMLNLEKFLAAALYPPRREQLVGILASTENPYSRMILKETEDVFTRSSLAYQVISSDQFKYMKAGDLQRFSTLTLILADEKDLKAADFKTYMAEGGNIISLQNGSFKELAPLFLSSYIEVPDKAKKTGFYLLPGFAMGSELLLKDATNEWRPGYLQPEAGTEIIGYDYQQQYPLLWTGRQGQGRFLIWNWDGFLGAQLIGLILESVLYVEPAAAVTTLGFAHMFIDDWPLPMYQSTKEGFDVSYHDFYVNTWWPDIRQLMADYRIPYSAYVIFNYNDIVNPPFTGSEFYSAGDESVLMARELLNSGVELGYHGYNHMSLTREATEVNLQKWPSIEAMEASIREGKRTWSILFGAETLPFAYVPVNNIISEEGVAALHSVMPSIKIVAPLRWGIEEETYSPITPHPYLPGIYYFPRISFGYKQTDVVTNLIISGVTGPGLISHFIHPDDVFDPGRSKGKTWPQLFSEFGANLEFIRTQYPWIQWVSIREAYQRLQAQDCVLSSFVPEGTRLKITTRTGTLLRVRARDFNGIKQLTGAESVYAYPEQQTYILRATANQVMVEFR